MKNATKNREFITLEVLTIGFVVYGIGPGARNCNYRGEPLTDFLKVLWEKLWDLKDKLNEDWRSLDRSNLENPANRPIIQRFLQTGAWAYALAVELTPFSKACVDGPTNPLYHIFIRRLEEIFTKCFAATHLCGSPDESMVGLRGLLTDFEANGGIDHETGVEGSGFYHSLLMYYVAYFNPTNREAVVYDRFGDLLESIASMATEKYPKVMPAFQKHVGDLLIESQPGFASQEFRSEAKTSLIERLSSLQKSPCGVQESEKTA